MSERGEVPIPEGREILYLPHGNVEITLVPEPVFDEFRDNATPEEVKDMQRKNTGEIY